MSCGMSNPNVLNVRCYAAHIIEINEYLAVFPGVKESDKIGETELE